MDYLIVERGKLNWVEVVYYCSNHSTKQTRAIKDQISALSLDCQQSLFFFRFSLRSACARERLAAEREKQGRQPFPPPPPPSG